MEINWIWHVNWCNLGTAGPWGVIRPAEADLPMNLILLSVRQAARTPGFSFTVILVLALGVGATTGIFSVVHSVLLNPFPYPRGGEILFIGSKDLNNPEVHMMPLTYPDYQDWRARAKSFAHLAYAHGTGSVLTGVEEPGTLRHAAISAEAWPLLGMEPELGRVFNEAEDHPGAPPVAVLSHATWVKHFGEEPGVLNQAIILDGRSYAVIGVMPPEFKFWAGDVWTPVGLQADTDLMRSRVLRMDSWAVGLLRPEVTQREALAELELIAGQLAEQYPESNKNVGAAMRLLSDSVTGPLQRPLLILLGAVACVLVIACANVANLLLARHATRAREYAVRAAVGASRGQLVGHMLMETAPLALAGGLAGVLLGAWGLDALLVILPPDAVPAEAKIEVNLPVIGVALLSMLGTMGLLALFPALESSRPNVASTLQEGSRGMAGGAKISLMRGTLVVVEVALSLILLTGAGLLLRSFTRLQAVDPGFNEKNLLVLPLQLPANRYPTSGQATQFFEGLAERVKTLPGVRTVGGATNVPLAGGMDLPLLVEGRIYDELSDLEGLQFSLVQGDFFRALGLELRQGRFFEDTDRAGSPPVAVLNEAAVRKFLPEGEPLGKRVMLGIPENLITPGLLPPGFDQFQWATVVGVVESARHFGLETEPIPAAYVPVTQGWDFLQLRTFQFLLVRTEGNPLDVVPLVREVVRSIDGNQPLGWVSSMEMMIGDALRAPRFNTLLLGLFAATALVLAVVGLYGVVAWNVAQRTREIGIRQALGADSSKVLRMVVGQSMRMVGLGVGLGLVISLALVRTLQGLLFEVSAFDPWTFGLVALLLGGSAFLACLPPAWRATRVNPMAAIRME